MATLLLPAAQAVVEKTLLATGGHYCSTRLDYNLLELCSKSGLSPLRMVTIQGAQGYPLD